MGDWWKGLLKFLIVVVSVAIAYFFAYIWNNLTPGGASETEMWIVGIVTFFAAVIGLYYGSRLKE